MYATRARIAADQSTCTSVPVPATMFGQLSPVWRALTLTAMNPDEFACAPARTSHWLSG